MKSMFLFVFICIPLFFYSQVVDTSTKVIQAVHTTIDTTKIYTDSGELARLEVWDKTIKNQNKLVYLKVYWEQMLDSSYVFVSKDGFVKVKDGITIPLDSLTPNYIIEKIVDKNNHEEIYMWLQGKRIMLSAPFNSKQKHIEVNGKEGIEYIWVNGEKVVLRKLTKSEVDSITEEAVREAAKYWESIGK